jgi:LysR family glycine cleavage system transcriptional activator
VRHYGVFCAPPLDYGQSAAKVFEMPMPHDKLDPKSIPAFAAVRAFEAVGRLGGIRAAAAGLSIDHSVVSRHLRHLEDFVGVALMVRESGGLHLTVDGARYHRRIAAALAELALATSEVRDPGISNDILVWCVPGFAAQWVTDRLAHFEQLWPEFHLELRPTDIRANLGAHEADVDIRFYLDDCPPYPAGQGLSFVELVRPPTMIVASPSIAASLADKTTLEDLLDLPLLHEEHDCQWRAWLTLNGIKRAIPERIPGTLLWHSHLALVAARNNRGLALANTFLVDADLKTGTLVEVNIPNTEPVALGAYAFVTREDRWSLDPALKFRRFLQLEIARFIRKT